MAGFRLKMHHESGITFVVVYTMLWFINPVFSGKITEWDCSSDSLVLEGNHALTEGLTLVLAKRGQWKFNSTQRGNIIKILKPWAEYW